MGIDKKTIPYMVNIVLEDKPEYLKMLKKQADEDGQNDEEKKKLSITDTKHVFQTEEYYFDEQDNHIYISGNMVSDKGETWITVVMPLSDTVLIDILQHAMKKFNKLKTVMESLK